MERETVCIMPFCIMGLSFEIFNFFNFLILQGIDGKSGSKGIKVCVFSVSWISPHWFIQLLMKPCHSFLLSACINDGCNSLFYAVGWWRHEGWQRRSWIARVWWCWGKGECSVSLIPCRLCTYSVRFMLKCSASPAISNSGPTIYI